MGKYFGTDGFRGEANVNLTADHAYKVGRFLGWYYGELKSRNGEGEARIVSYPCEISVASSVVGVKPTVEVVITLIGYHVFHKFRINVLLAFVVAFLHNESCKDRQVAGGAHNTGISYGVSAGFF